MEEKISKEKLESWYTPKSEINLTEKEELVAEEKCTLCNGTGEVDNYSYDSDAHEYVLDGTRKCVLCKLEEFEE